jgi:hypothetical protein
VICIIITCAAVVSRFFGVGQQRTAQKTSDTFVTPTITSARVPFERMSEVGEIEQAVDHFAGNQEFIRLYNRHNRELLLQHFLLIAAAGDEVWRINQEKKMSMPEQRDLMLMKYIEWLDKRPIEFPEVHRPPDVNEEWWRLMLLAYERKPVSGKSLWRKFKEDARNPILSSFNHHWAEPREGETLEDRFRLVRRGVWRDLGHREEEFLPEGSWLPKQWYAWRYCCYPGKNMRAFDGKLPSVNAGTRRQAQQMAPSGRHSESGAWPAALPMDSHQAQDAAQHSSLLMANSGAQQASGYTMSNQQPSSSSSGVRTNRAVLPSTVANQRLLAAAASMSRVRAPTEDEVQVQQYLADVQQYTAQMARLEKAAALAEQFGELDKAAGFKRQLYEHVQSEPPARLKRMAVSVRPLPLEHVAQISSDGVDALNHSGGSSSGQGQGQGQGNFTPHGPHAGLAYAAQGVHHLTSAAIASAGRAAHHGYHGGHSLGHGHSASMPVLHAGHEDGDGEGEEAEEAEELERDGNGSTSDSEA